jgi:imidazole glycerol-phosphate synthase subunit HisF
MLSNRVIPTLLLSDGGLYKTIKFKNPAYVGDPINAIKIFNDKEVDELIVIDISATKNKLEPDFHLIEQFAGECFIPLTYGGGIKTLRQAEKIFSLGIEKICVQTKFASDLNFIKSLVDNFGSSSVVASIDLNRNWFNQICVYNYVTAKSSKQNWKELIDNYCYAGVGEIFLNCVDCDGAMAGPDTDLIRQVAAHTYVPLIACGGVSSLSDVKSIIECGADAAAAGSFFVFHGPHRAVLITYPEYEDLSALLNI